MKTLERNELYQNLQEFLKAKGVELSAGSYSQKIQKSCELLSDAINSSQRGIVRAKIEIDKKLDQLRQVIHEKTAPAGSSTGSKPQTAASNQSPPPKTAPKKAPSRKRAKGRK